MRTLATVLLVSVLLAGCERAPRADDPDRASEAQLEAARDACIAAALLDRARESLEALEAFGQPDAPPAGAAGAARLFARAYHQHANLRYAALAHADSALNHAASSADSARYMQAGQAFIPRPPEPETLEGNVSAAWVSDFAGILADEDHRCHWDLPLGDEP